MVIVLFNKCFLYNCLSNDDLIVSEHLKGIFPGENCSRLIYFMNLFFESMVPCLYKIAELKQMMKGTWKRSSIFVKKIYKGLVQYFYWIWANYWGKKSQGISPAFLLNFCKNIEKITRGKSSIFIKFLSKYWTNHKG